MALLGPWKVKIRLTSKRRAAAEPEAAPPEGPPADLSFDYLAQNALLELPGSPPLAAALDTIQNDRPGAGAGVQMKSYYAGTIKAAMEQARQELGEDAVLVESRKTSPEHRELGQYEVIFGVVPQPPPAAAATKESAPVAPAPAPPPLLFHHPAGRRVDPVVASPAPLRKSQPSLRESLQRELMERGLSEEEAVDLLDRVGRRLGGEETPVSSRPVSFHRAGSIHLPKPAKPAGEAQWKSALYSEMLSRISVDTDLSGWGRPRVVVLLGPPASGKTSTAVKLALTHGVAKGRPTFIFALDNYRVSGSEQLRCYAAMMDVPFREAASAAELRVFVSQLPASALALVDTAGYGPKDLEPAAELARELGPDNDWDGHLVIPANLRPEVIRRAVDRFEIFAPSKLLFTRMDEVESSGVLYREAARTGKSISFLGTGQSIPADLVEASPEAILEPFSLEEAAIA